MSKEQKLERYIQKARAYVDAAQMESQKAHDLLGLPNDHRNEGSSILYDGIFNSEHGAKRILKDLVKHQKK